MAGQLTVRVAGSLQRNTRYVLLLVGIIFLVAGGHCGERLEDEPILPVPEAHGQDPAKAALGEKLFHDSRLSADDTVSCSSCHRLGIGGMDGLPRSVGVQGAMGVVNAPTVYNSRFNLTQFWDGRSPSLEEQVNGPLHNPIEMASGWPQVLVKLGMIPDYSAEFHALYPDGITPANVRDAIATFERTLTTPDSRFDRWLRGDAAALSDRQREGYALFKSYGCVSCHQGRGVGGNMYQRMGALGDYFSDRGGEVTRQDLGRYNVTGDPQDRHYFKVPSLRLAALTAPYFHDAGANTLEKAIEIMGRYQLGREIPTADVSAVAAFLHSLVGMHPRLQP